MIRVVGGNVVGVGASGRGQRGRGSVQRLESGRSTLLEMHLFATFLVLVFHFKNETVHFINGHFVGVSQTDLHF